MEEKLEKVRKILFENGQEHLLSFYDDLSVENKELLLNQILNIDFDLMKKLYASTRKKC